MKHPLNHKLILALAIPALLATGCKTVVRENIISSVETGVGISLAENPKTEMYEVKIGIIRSQFYSVPTGKVVENEKNHGGNADKRSNSADVTPEIVSGIRLQTSAKQLFLGADISENFAVGKIAVMSPAAVAMYVSQADTDAKATQASLAAASVSAQTIPLAATNGAAMAPLRNAYNHFAADPAKLGVFNAAAKKANSAYADFRSFLLSKPTNDEIQTVRAELENDAEIKPFIK